MRFSSTESTLDMKDDLPQPTKPIRSMFTLSTPHGGENDATVSIMPSNSCKRRRHSHTLAVPHVHSKRRDFLFLRINDTDSTSFQTSRSSEVSAFYLSRKSDIPHPQLQLAHLWCGNDPLRIRRTLQKLPKVTKKSRFVDRTLPSARDDHLCGSSIPPDSEHHDRPCKDIIRTVSRIPYT